MTRLVLVVLGLAPGLVLASGADGGVAAPLPGVAAAPVTPTSVSMRRVSSDSLPVTAVTNRLDEMLRAMLNEVPGGKWVPGLEAEKADAWFDVTLELITNGERAGAAGAEKRVRYVFVVRGPGSVSDRVAFEQRPGSLGPMGARAMLEVVLRTAFQVAERGRAFRPHVPQTTADAGVLTPPPLLSPPPPVVSLPGVSPELVDAPSGTGPSVSVGGSVGLYLAQPWQPRAVAAVARELQARIQVLGRLNADIDALVELRARYDAALPYRNAFGLWQAWVRLNTGPVEWTAGRQLLDWGPSAYGPSDRLTPFDYSDYFRPERMPVLALRSTLSLGRLKVSGVMVPMWDPGIWPDFADYEKVSVDAYSSRNPWDWDTAFADPTTAQPYHFNKPPPSFSLGAAVYALRLAYDFEEVSLGAGFHVGPDSFIELGEVTPLSSGGTSMTINVTPQRVRAFYADVTFRPGGWKVAVMAQALLTDTFSSPDSSLATTAEPSYGSAAVHASRDGLRLGDAVALDLFAQVALDVQFSTLGGQVSARVNPPAQSGTTDHVVYRSYYTNGLIAGATLRVYDHLLFSATGFLSWGEIGSAVQGGVGWSFAPGTIALLQAEAYLGNPDQLTSKFRGTNNRVSLLLRHSFGQ